MYINIIAFISTKREDAGLQNSYKIYPKMLERNIGSSFLAFLLYPFKGRISSSKLVLITRRWTCLSYGKYRINIRDVMNFTGNISVDDVSERKIRFTSNLPLKELLEKIEDIQRWDSEYENKMD
ncbi:hypothetical protein FRX31_013708, partial [Thalictrum thalictroides]